MKCNYDPTELADAPIGQFHCPECGEMVIAGMPHPPSDEENAIIELRRQLKRAARSIRIWRRRALNANDDDFYWHKFDGTITDGFGSVWSAVCPDCGGDMVVMRPGDARCSRECWNE